MKLSFGFLPIFGRVRSEWNAKVRPQYFALFDKLRDHKCRRKPDLLFQLVLTKEVYIQDQSVIGLDCPTSLTERGRYARRV